MWAASSELIDSSSALEPTIVQTRGDVPQFSSILRANPVHKELRIKPRPSNAKFSTSICLSDPNLDYAVFISWGDSCIVERLDLHTLSWISEPPLVIEIKSDRIQAFSDSEVVVVVSLSPTQFVATFKFALTDLTIIPIENQVVPSISFYIPSSHQVFILSEDMKSAINVDILSVLVTTKPLLGSIPQMKSVFASCSVSSSIVVLFGSGQTSIAVIDSNSMRYLDLPSSVTTPFQNDGSMQSACFHQMDPAFLLFNKFQSKESSSTIQLFSPNSLPLPDPVCIVRCSFQMSGTVECMFSGGKFVFYFISENAGYTCLNCLLFSPPLSAPMPIICQNEPIGVKFVIPPIEHPLILEKCEFLVRCSEGKLRRIVPVEAKHEPQEVTVCVMQGAAFRASIQLTNGCGSIESPPVIFVAPLVQVPQAPTGVNVEEDEEGHTLIKWEKPLTGLPASGFIIQASSNSADFHDIFNVDDGTAIGVRAIVNREYSAFRVISTNDSGRGRPSVAASMKKETNEDLRRYIWTQKQRERLEEYYKESKKPSLELREQISQELGAPIRSVSFWFQNKRAKDRAPKKA